MSDEVEVEEILNRYQIDTLYYFCHIKNVPSILRKGILSRNRAKDECKEFADISDHGAQSQRCARTLDGSLKWLNDTARTLHDCVPLYFSRHTPTQNVLTVRARNRDVCLNDDIVFFDVNPVAAFQTPGRKFTDGNAAIGKTRIYDNISDLDKLHWEYIRKPSDFDIIGSLVYNKEYKRTKCSEVLVPDQIPIEHVKRLVVASRTVEEAICGYCTFNEAKCVVDKTYYYWK